MQVQLKHRGYQRRNDDYVHQYTAFAENGWAGVFEDEDFVRDGSYNLPDHVFQLSSGWVTWLCDGCGLVFRVCTHPGGPAPCPICGTVGVVPIDAQIEPDMEEE